MTSVDSQQQREALARLENDYLRGLYPPRSTRDSRASFWATLQQPLRPFVQGSSRWCSLVDRNVDSVTGTHLASWGRRAAAWFIDLVVIVFIWSLAFAWAIATRDDFGDVSHSHRVVLYVVFFSAAPIYQWLMIGTWGQTLGKMALGIKVVQTLAASPMRVPWDEPSPSGFFRSSS